MDSGWADAHPEPAQPATDLLSLARSRKRSRLHRPPGGAWAPPTVRNDGSWRGFLPVKDAEDRAERNAILPNHGLWQVLQPDVRGWLRSVELFLKRGIIEATAPGCEPDHSIPDGFLPAEELAEQRGLLVLIVEGHPHIAVSRIALHRALLRADHACPSLEVGEASEAIVLGLE
jgi:hypothetical protein